MFIYNIQHYVNTALIVFLIISQPLIIISQPLIISHSLIISQPLILTGKIGAIIAQRLFDLLGIQ